MDLMRMTLWYWLKDQLCPSTCLLCDERVAEGLICTGCCADISENLHACRCCAEPLLNPVLSPAEGFPSLICARCQQQTPAFEQVSAPFLYDFPLRELITRFKERDDLLLSRLLADLLCDALLPLSDAERPDLILPVPTHWRSRLQRGFNPAALLADGVSRRLKCPLENHLLIKTRYTPAQHLLNREQRLRNLRGSFSLRWPHRVTGKRILLVDDVVTTGRTADVIAALLRDNGARSVSVWALARTPVKTL